MAGMSAKAVSHAGQADYVMVHRCIVEKYGNLVALVYGLVERRCGGKPSGWCIESVPNMAKYLRMAERTMKQALAELVEAGEIERSSRPGMPSAYTMVEPTQVQLNPGQNEPGTQVRMSPAPRSKRARHPGQNEPAKKVLKRLSIDSQEKEQVRGADSSANRSKADRLAGDHQVLAIMTGLGISDGQARRLSMHFTSSEAMALADVARRQEPDDLGAYAARLFREAAANQASRDALPGGIEKAVMAGRAAYRAVVELGAEPGLAVKAALLLTSGEKRPYVTTADACSCAWAWYHPGQACKHRLAVQLGQGLKGARP
jgi:hypothetical protein